MLSKSEAQYLQGEKQVTKSFEYKATILSKRK